MDTFLRIVLWLIITFIFVVCAGLFYGICEAIFLSDMWGLWKALLFFTVVDIYAIVCPYIAKHYEYV